MQPLFFRRNFERRADVFPASLSSASIAKEAFKLQELTLILSHYLSVILGGVLSDGRDRQYIYALIQRACGEFKKRAGSLICGELLSGSAAVDTSPAPDERTEEYYKSRPCAELIKTAAEITEKIIEREGGKS